MRKTLSMFAGAALICAGGQQVSAQVCYTISSVETVDGSNTLGKVLNPAYCYFNWGGAAGVVDGDTISMNNNNVDGEPTRVYEFDIDNSGVTPGRIPVNVSSSDPLPDAVKANRALVEAINNDPMAPFHAGHYPPYVGIVWKYDGGYGATNSEIQDAGSAFQVRSFNYINAPNRSYVFFHGSGFPIPNSQRPTFKLIKSDDAGVTRNGSVTYRSDALYSVWFGIDKTSGQEALPDGLYDIEVTKTGCDTIVLPKAIRIVENLLDDATFSTNVLGNFQTLNWNGNNALQSPFWYPFNPYDDVSPSNPNSLMYRLVKKGSLVANDKADAFSPAQTGNPTSNACPRQGPIITGFIATNNANGALQGGDDLWGSLKFDDTADRLQLWQYIDTNLPEATFCTLTALWTGGTTAPATISYGIEIRENDENGTVLASTAPRMATDKFDWTLSKDIVTLPGGPKKLAVLVYAENSDAVDAGMHFDELLLRTGADLWPDADGDGDVDGQDFAAFQLCLTGADAGPYSDESCARFDRNDDTDVDAADFAEFANCGTGPDVPLTPANLPVGCSL